MFFNFDNNEIKYKELKAQVRAVVDKGSTASVEDMKEKIKNAFINDEITAAQRDELLRDLDDYYAFIRFMMYH